MLLKAGFTYRPGKGSHTIWSHPKVPRTITIAGKDGSDAKSYLEKQVQDALETLDQLEGEDTEE